jgi:tetratricopeptide (TPR) repeat protein
MIDPIYDSEESDDDSGFGLANLDFQGVKFDAAELTNAETNALDWERQLPFHAASLQLDDNSQDDLISIKDIEELLSIGRYVDILRGAKAQQFFRGSTQEISPSEFLRQQVHSQGHSVMSCIEIECIAVAALNLFLQANYTGPSLETSDVPDINPHSCFSEWRDLSVMEPNKTIDKTEEEKKSSVTGGKRNSGYQNSVLAELAVDGIWPVQVCQVPYFLWLARTILAALNDSQALIYEYSRHLKGLSLWKSRSIVAHERLLHSREPSQTLWVEAQSTFRSCFEIYCDTSSTEYRSEGATVMLEWGLAQFHFQKKSLPTFRNAQNLSGLTVEVTGSIGKRTKYQQEATAQLLVRAQSNVPASETTPSENTASLQRVEHSNDEILLEKIQFEDERDMEIKPLTILDQSILMAFCLDVKESNVADELTAEEMGAYLARVLDHHDDWMVYSTALLERSWLEFERTHARERAILQIQALVDQHTNRLTITQSTVKSIEESAPVQIRLRNLHLIVYPPRWSMIQDLADRYAKLGIVTSAAELYTDIEFWNDVVDCYRRAGKMATAEAIVRERLEMEESPRMWEALGDITNDPECFEKAIEVSHGRYSSAFLALGSHYFDKGQIETAAEYYEKALKIRPLVTSAWFRLGTIQMQLEHWEAALRAFSEVVQQEPEEYDAWANVAAIHIRQRRPAEAYPALMEALKYNRNNWRVWVSKLYTCLDLNKFDEAVQACEMLLDLRKSKQASDGIPPLEERCVRAIVGGTLKSFEASAGNEIQLDSSRRTLSRVHALLERLSTSSDAEPWTFETMAVFNQAVGQNEEVLDNLLKEYRSLQAVAGWEKDNKLVIKICRVASQISNLYCQKGDKQNLTKARFLVGGVKQKIEASRPGDNTIPEEVLQLAHVMDEIEIKLSGL